MAAGIGIFTSRSGLNPSEPRLPSAPPEIIARDVDVLPTERGNVREQRVRNRLAAAAAIQFVVTKEFKAERTRTSLVEATGGSREEEIARMLGGKSTSALAHARALLNEKIARNLGAGRLGA